MSELVFVTGNQSKYREAASILEQFGIRLEQKDLKLIEPKFDDPRRVVRWKAQRAFRRLNRPLLVDDTALILEGYPCFPGAYTATMARVLGVNGLRRLLDPNHPAAFRCHVCYHDGRARVFTGSWSGRMQPADRFAGADWKYDSFFIPEGFDCPLEEIPLEVRMRVSHRRRALAKLGRFLRKRRVDGQDGRED